MINGNLIVNAYVFFFVWYTLAKSFESAGTKRMKSSDSTYAYVYMYRGYVHISFKNTYCNYGIYVRSYVCVHNCIHVQSYVILKGCVYFVF